MTTTSITNVVMVPVGSPSWRMGLGNLTKKEFSLWWGTKLWWIQTLVWMVVLNFVTTIVMRDSSGLTAAALADEAVRTFFQVGATAIPIGIVLTLQGAIVGERELGTAAWVLSKPVSRASFVLSKLIAHFTGFAVTAILIPSVIFLVTAGLILPEPIRLAPFGIALAVSGLMVLFYVTLTLALGCLVRGRGAIAGIGISLILVGQFLKGSLPLPLVMVMPWLLGDVAASFAMEQIPDFNRIVPLVAVSILTVLLAVLANWRFAREEF